VQTNVIITGASCGIGKEIAKVFINSGCRVFNLSRTLCSISGVENYSIDLKDTEALENSVLTIKDELARDKKYYKLILVHNACTFIKDSLSNVDSRLFMDALQVSLLAPALINKALIARMSQGSAILYIGSTLSEKAVCNTLSYTTIKHAVLGAMRATCQDLQEYPGVHTCCVCPGFTNTQMLQSHIDENILLDIKKRVSANRLIEASEIADIVYYCAKQPVVNGSVIHANLGQIET
jgi:NAD(P)-dependent dehydrogenase (short-subunit alcohol dehydrogenase family)